MFHFVGDKANPLHFHSHCDDSDNEIVSMMVGGAAVIAAAFHNLGSCNNHHNNVNDVDNDDDSLQSSNRKWHCGVLFRSARRRFDYGRAKEAIDANYLQPDSLYGSEFRNIFKVSRPRFEDIMTKIMNTPDLEFYQDLRGRQGKSSSDLEAMLLYPLKTLAFCVPFSEFVDYFQISIQFGMKICREFDAAIKAHYMREFLLSWESPKSRLLKI